MIWELVIDECTKCGDKTMQKSCDGVDCDEGYVHKNPHDPIGAQVGLAFTMCFRCLGTGVINRCESCGWDLIAKCYKNGNPN